MLKSHDAPTANVAAALAASASVHVFGSVCCDVGIGGLNSVAIDNALAFGAKIVWLPTFSSSQDWHRHGRNHDVAWPGVAVCDGAGNSCPQQRTAQSTFAAGAIVATGHISVREHLAVARARPGRRSQRTHQRARFGGILACDLHEAAIERAGRR